MQVGFPFEPKSWDLQSTRLDFPSHSALNSHRLQSHSFQCFINLISFNPLVSGSTMLSFNIPKSMEAFYQESGRAGRDQLPSKSLLYYGVDDRKRMVS